MFSCESKSREQGFTFVSFLSLKSIYKSSEYKDVVFLTIRMEKNELFGVEFIPTELFTILILARLFTDFVDYTLTYEKLNDCSSRSR